VVGGENLARSEIKSCVCHSSCLSFVLSVYIIPQSQAKVNSFRKNNVRQIAQTFGGKKRWICIYCTKRLATPGSEPPKGRSICPDPHLSF
jgi:hypothetical protein